LDFFHPYLPTPTTSFSGAAPIILCGREAALRLLGRFFLLYEPAKACCGQRRLPIPVVNQLPSFFPFSLAFALAEDQRTRAPVGSVPLLFGRAG